MYGVTIPEGLSPYELYINGKLVGGLGDLTLENEKDAPIKRPVTYYFTLNTTESDIIMAFMPITIYKVALIEK